jgi:hypothetical protein
MLPLALALAAFVAASVGQRKEAEEFLAEGLGVSSRGSAADRILSRGYTVGARSVLALQRDPRKELRELISEAEDRGFIAVELELRLLSLAFGDFEGPHVETAAVIARAFLDEDIDVLLRFGAGEADPGWRRMAGRCREEALRLARASGDRALLSRVQRVLNKKNGQTEDQLPKAGVPLLTRRERDIAALVIQGHRNAEIAERLYRTFEKLGISRREDLKQELLTQHGPE